MTGSAATRARRAPAPAGARPRRAARTRAGRQRDRVTPAAPGTSAAARRRGMPGARVARPAAVAQQVDVQLELGAGRRQPQHLVVQLVERRARPQQAQPRPDARDVRVDRHVAARVGEQQHAGRRLAADAGQRAQRSARLARPARRASTTRSRSSGSASSICLMRRDFWTCRPPGWIASSTSSTGASRTACQSGKRSRRRRNATSRLRSLVDCERTVSTSSASGSPCGAIAGVP